MNITKADLWDLHRANETICITTNGEVKKNGRAVMGRGCARECAERLPETPLVLGNAIRQQGNRVYFYARRNLFFFPVKHAWWERADIDLIRTSIQQLSEEINYRDCGCVFLPMPGCGNGGLTWTQVAPLFEGCHPHIIVVDKYLGTPIR